MPFVPCISEFVVLVCSEREVFFCPNFQFGERFYMRRKNLWIDTDMGNDDLMALAMLAQYPQIKIQAISLVNGVSRVKKGLSNLKGVLEYLKLNPLLFEDTSIKIYPYKLEFPKQDINRAEELTLL